MTRLIDVDNLLKELENWNEDLYGTSSGRQLGVTDAIVIARQMPTVNAVPVRHGKWLWVDGVRCSQCNYKLATTGLPSYCPNCGARMKGADNDTVDRCK